VFGKVPHGAAFPAPEEIDLSIVDHVREIDYRVTIALWAVRSCCHSPHLTTAGFRVSELRVDEKARAPRFRGNGAYPIPAPIRALDRK
jgi:hypothetical protein